MPTGGKLTAKQAKFVEALKKNPKMYLQDAARAAGYGSPHSRANQALKNVNVRNALKSYLKTLEGHGVNDKKSARVISEAMDAKKIHGTDDNFIEIEDHPTRLKANEQYLRLKRLIGYDEDEEKDNNSIQILIVNYEADSNPGSAVPAAAVSPRSFEDAITIQNDQVAPARPKNNARGK